MDTGWQLDADTVVCGRVRVAVRRLGATHWRPQGVLRSWGLVPLHRDGSRLCVPCGDAEVLWIGAWLEPAGGCAVVSLANAHGGDHSEIVLPHAYAITSFGGDRPLARAPGEAQRDWVLRVRVPDDIDATIGLRLMTPTAWSTLSGQRWNALSVRPPPPPPRLG